MRNCLLSLILALGTSTAGTAMADDLAKAIQHLRAGEYAQAHQLIKPIAESGNPVAQRNLGIMYLRGDGIPRDETQGRAWLTRSANAGDAPAMNELGVLYYFGHGMEKDYVQALAWFSKAAALDHPESQSFLGDLYRFGRAVPKDYRKAVRWYEKSASRNYPHALYMLGVMHGQGLGVEKNRDKATAYYRRAAAHGHPEAARMLAATTAPALDIKGVSSDPEYGYRANKAIHTGGISAARQRAYLGRLRGPGGEALSYRRTGGCAAYQDPAQAFGQAIIDCYEVTWPGLAAPKVLFINLYRNEPLWAPQGFTLTPP